MEKLMTPREVADLLSVSLGAVHRWSQQGRLRSVRAGHRLRFRPNDVESFLRDGGNGHRAEPSRV
jgi:excisionase family DNA binding protein